MWHLEHATDCERGESGNELFGVGRAVACLLSFGARRNNYDDNDLAVRSCRWAVVPACEFTPQRGACVAPDALGTLAPITPSLTIAHGISSTKEETKFPQGNNDQNG